MPPNHRRLLSQKVQVQLQQQDGACPLSGDGPVWGYGELTGSSPVLLTDGDECRRYCKWKPSQIWSKDDQGPTGRQQRNRGTVGSVLRQIMSQEQMLEEVPRTVPHGPQIWGLPCGAWAIYFDKSFVIHVIGRHKSVSPSQRWQKYHWR